MAQPSAPIWPPPVGPIGVAVSSIALMVSMPRPKADKPNRLPETAGGEPRSPVADREIVPCSSASAWAPAGDAQPAPTSIRTAADAADRTSTRGPRPPMRRPFTSP